jgi:hypothetical protein
MYYTSGRREYIDSIPPLTGKDISALTKSWNIRIQNQEQLCVKITHVSLRSSMRDKKHQMWPTQKTHPPTPPRQLPNNAYAPPRIEDAEPMRAANSALAVVARLLRSRSSPSLDPMAKEEGHDRGVKGSPSPSPLDLRPPRQSRFAPTPLLGIGCL